MIRDGPGWTDHGNEDGRKNERGPDVWPLRDLIPLSLNRLSRRLNPKLDLVYRMDILKAILKSPVSKLLIFSYYLIWFWGEFGRILIGMGL